MARQNVFECFFVVVFGLFVLPNIQFFGQGSDIYAGWYSFPPVNSYRRYAFLGEGVCAYPSSVPSLA